ncbi:MAG: DUF58 domain-containing protein [Gammaproteobacteria bacterium]
MTVEVHLDELLELRHPAHALGLATRHQVASVMSGLYASVFRGRGMEFEETRCYQEGDEIRHMDWRVTARTGMPHLKLFAEERERAVVLCVDASAPMHFGTRGTLKLVQAVRAAALLGWAASLSQDRVGALIFGEARGQFQFFRPTRGRRALWRLLNALTQTAAAGVPAREPLSEALAWLDRLTPTGAVVFVIADFDGDAKTLEVPLGRLRQRREVVLVAVSDVADRMIPDLGSVVFADAAGRRVWVDTASAEGRERYRQSWERNRSALEQLVTRLGLSLIPVWTHDEIHQALAAGLRRRWRQQRGRR